MAAKRRARRSDKPAARRAEQPGAGLQWLPGLAVVLLTITTLLPTDSIGHDSLCLIVLMWLLGCGCWLYARLKQNRGIVFATSDLWWCLAAIFVAIGAWITLPLGDARRGLNATITWSIYPIVFFMVRDIFRDDQARKSLVAWMIAISVGLATYGLYQFFYGMPTTRADFEAFTPEERAAVLTGLEIASDVGSPQLRHFLDRLRSTEPYATFGGLANSLAGFLATWSLLALPLLVEAAFSGKSSTSHSVTGHSVTGHSVTGHSFTRGSTAALLLAAAIVALCLVLTKSRASWLALALTGGIMSWKVGPSGWKRWKLPLILVGAAAVMIGLGVLLGPVDREVVTQTKLSLDYRVQYWQATVAMIQDHWMLGVGAGNFQGYYSQYKLAAASEQISDPHQFILELWATLGIVPLLSFLGYLGWRYASAWRSLIDGNANAQSRDDASSDATSDNTTAGNTTAGNATAGKTTDDTDPAGSAGLSIRAVLTGGIAGCLGVVVCGLPFRQSLETVPGTLIPVIWAVVLPASAFTFVCLQAWIAKGAWQRWWCLMAVAALLINLSAAGGISFPAVACSMWCLLAISDVRQVRQLSQQSLLLAILGLLLFSASFALLFLRPVLERQRHMLDYGNAQSGQEASTSLSRAIHADPRSPEPTRFAAVTALRRWLELERRDGERVFGKALDQMLATNPHSESTRALAGRMALTAFAATMSEEWLDRAIVEFEMARQLYPNYAMSHARLAWAYHLAGRAGEAARAADFALKLDTMHAHEEHKLRQLSVESLDRPPWQTPERGQTSAEQSMNDLRKTISER